MRTLMVLVLLSIMSTALARPPFAVPGSSQSAAPGKPSTSPAIRGIRQSPGMGTQQATALVKQECIDCKILSVRISASHGPQVYKVKTLSSQGVIKYVYVDGNSGSIF